MGGMPKTNFHYNERLSAGASVGLTDAEALLYTFTVSPNERSERGIHCMSTKRTWQPKIRRRKRVHGFRQRMKTAKGRKVLSARRRAGRHSLTVTPNHVKKVNWKSKTARED